MRQILSWLNLFKKAIIYLPLFIFISCSSPPVPIIYYDPEPVFNHPPPPAYPGVLWMWMGTNLSKEGITADLEALKEAGFGKATMASLSDITIPWSMVIQKSPTPQFVTGSKPWWQLVKFAAQECKRLGIEFGMFNCPGYETSGGPWITPEKSMQELCWSETWVWGNNEELKLALPKPVISPYSQLFYPVYDTVTGQVDHPVIPGRQTYYKDIAILAMPVQGVVKASDVINLTDQLDSNSILHWRPPVGNWSVYRFGHTTTGAIVQPAQPQAAGLECDKMNPEAVSLHIDHVIADLRQNLGDLLGKSFTHVNFDSYEAGMPSWTPKMKEEFGSRRGYDLTPYLAVFTGRTIENTIATIHFRRDFEVTMDDLHRDVYFKILSQKLQQAGLQFTCEPYGGPWQMGQVIPNVHRSLTEFWTDSGRFTPLEVETTVNELHREEKNIVDAEAFTGQPAFSQWNEYPAGLKPIGDAAFCAGINHLMLHRFVHQPWPNNYLPGNTMGQWGTHFDRTQTWWKPAKAMVQYWQRCQALLQWGHYVEKSEKDFSVTSASPGLQIDYTHRQQGASHIYFVANLKQQSGEAECSFNVSGSQPELWDPVTGEMKELPFDESGGKTSLSIPFNEAQSYFIVFRKKKTAEDGAPVSKPTVITTLLNPWTVTFDPRWGGPDTAVVFQKLSDWSLSSQKGIRYYSGTAVYTTQFDAPSTAAIGKTLYLHLGKVNHIASVTLNGVQLGVVWTAPWQIRIPSKIIRQTNTLQIAVTNVWANRLIGDEQEPSDAEWGSHQYFYNSGQYLKSFPDWFLKRQARPSKGRYCFTTWNYFTKDSPLQPSGLVGPVRLMSE